MEVDSSVKLAWAIFATKTRLRNQSEEFFKNGINGWKHSLGKFIDRDGGYVEK